MKKIILLITVSLNLTVFSQDRFQQVKKNTMEGTKVGVVDTENGEEIIPPLYDNIGEYSEGKFTVLLNNLVGAIDTLNNVVIPIEYITIKKCKDNRFFVMQEDDKWAIANDQGIFLSDFTYDEILGFQEGVIRAKINGKIGYLDENGKTILPFEFEEGYDCYGDFILIYGSTWKSLGLDYVESDIFGNELNRADIGISGKMPIIYNKKGQIIYTGEDGEKVRFASTFTIAIIENYIAEYGNNYYKIIQASGEESLSYEDMCRGLDVKEHWIQMKIADRGWKYGIVDFNGNLVLKPIFSKLSDYTYDNGNLARIYFEDGNYFHIDKNAKCVDFNGVSCP